MSASTTDKAPPTAARAPATGPELGGEVSTIYLAAPLFTQAEWQWNARLAEKLRQVPFDVILPQEAEPIVEGRAKFDPVALFKGNVAAIDRAQAVVAILDGAEADSGTCWECGYAFKLGVPIIGVRTDLRNGGDHPAASMNLMLAQSCAQLVKVPFEKREDIGWLAERIQVALRLVMA
jgi:nucleoside 2-deoxyribosyltransferase